MNMVPAVIFFSLFASILPSHSATIRLSTTDSVISGKRNQGWWSDTFENVARNPKYLIGTFGIIVQDNRATYRSHVSFDLPDLDEQVISATLRLTRFGSAGGELPGDRNNINSGVVQTIELFDVSTNAVVLNTTDGINLRIFEDVGTGGSYGHFDRLQIWNASGVEEFALNRAALDAINAAGPGAFSIGLTLPSATPNVNHFLFGPSFWDDSVQELVLVTPEPGYSALGTVVGLLFVSRRRRHFSGGKD